MRGTGRATFALLATLVLAAAGCADQAERDGGSAGAAGERQGSEAEASEQDGAEVAAEPECRPQGTEIDVVALHFEKGEPPAFDKECLAAPAGEPFTIRMKNEDILEHNVSIYSADEDDLLFRGDRIRGPDETITYEVPAIDEAGTYLFICDVHRTLMRGTFVVE